MTLKILALILLSSNITFCQSANDYIFIKDSLAYVMTEPNQESKIIAKIERGDLITIEERTSNLIDLEDGYTFWVCLRPTTPLNQAGVGQVPRVSCRVFAPKLTSSNHKD